MKKFVFALLVFIILTASVFAQGRRQGRNTTQYSETLSAVIIGSGAPQYNSKRAGPSVLIRYKDQNILVDMGNGAQANLSKIGFNYRQLDGIFITHHHLDHNEEFIPVFVHALLRGNKFEVVGPKPTREYVSSVSSIYEKDITYRLSRRQRGQTPNGKNFSVRELDGGESFSIKDINITTTRVNHTIETVAYRFEAGGKSIVVSGDLTYSGSLSKLARNADVLVVDSGVVIRKNVANANNLENRRGNRGSGNRNRRAGGQNKTGQNGGRRGQGNRQGRNGQRAHATLAEVAKMAQDANVKKLVMNHLPPAEVDENATMQEVAKTYRGEIVMAKDLLEIKTSARTIARVTDIEGGFLRGIFAVFGFVV